jgi:hypothetical protein
MALQGADGLRRRLRAIKAVATNLEREWAGEATRIARASVPVKTGQTRASIRATNPSAGRIKVVGKYTVNFIDAGAKEHDEPRSRYTKTGRLRRGKAAGTGKVLKFQVGGQTYFRRKVHKRSQPAHPFKARSAQDALRKVDPTGEIVKRWNQAD